MLHNRPKRHATAIFAAGNLTGHFENSGEIDDKNDYIRLIVDLDEQHL